MNKQIIKSLLLLLTIIPLLYGETVEFDENIKRQMMVRELTNQVIIAEYAKNDPDLHVRWVASDMLNDQTLISDIAQKSVYSDARMRAVMKLADLSIVESIAKNDGADVVRNHAELRLESQVLLDDLAKNDSLVGVDNSATFPIDEMIMLMMQVKHGSEEQPRLWAAKKLQYQPALQDFATNSTRQSAMRQEAITHLADKSLVQRIAKNDKDESVRQSAMSRLDDLNKKEQAKGATPESTDEKTKGLKKNAMNG